MTYADALVALADPTRRRILDELRVARSLPEGSPRSYPSADPPITLFQFSAHVRDSERQPVLLQTRDQAAHCGHSRCAFTMIWLLAAWRNTSVRRTTGTAPLAIMSASTWPGPTEGSWSTSPTRKMRLKRP